MIQGLHSGLGHGLFSQLIAHAVGTDLVHFIKGDAHTVQRVGGKAHGFQHTAQNAAVVDVDHEIIKADLEQRTGGGVDQFHLGVGAFIPQNVNVALHKLAQTAPLRALGAEHTVGLDHLKGVRQLGAVGGVIAGKRQSKIIAQAHIGKRFFLHRGAGKGTGQLFAAL